MGAGKQQVAQLLNALMSAHKLELVQAVGEAGQSARQTPVFRIPEAGRIDLMTGLDHLHQHVYQEIEKAGTAGVWKKNHVPQKLLAWVAKFHRWQRG